MAPATLQLETLAAGIQLAKVEGIIPAPEANHAVEGAIREDLRCKEKGERRKDGVKQFCSPMWTWLL